MREETAEKTGPLRTGFSTGACATAAALAAARLLCRGESTSAVSITLPKGQTVEFELDACGLDGDAACAAVIKDAGDDPDVTHGARITVSTRKSAQPGVHFFAGEGVGTVTRAGLPVAVGEPAINPVPRKMITEHLVPLLEQGCVGLDVIIGVENGAQLAAKTMNPRLGIVGGLSILGTTGIVRPFSCSAYIASIHQGMDVARANGVEHIAACTGNASEILAQRVLQLDEMALIEMGDFIGAVIKHLKKTPFAKVSFVGGFAKFCKLAQGEMDLHSRASQVNFDFLAELAGEGFASAISQANTAFEALQICPSLAEKVAQLAGEQVRQRIAAEIAVEIFIADKNGAQLAHWAAA